MSGEGRCFYCGQSDEKKRRRRRKKRWLIHSVHSGLKLTLTLTWWRFSESVSECMGSGYFVRGALQSTTGLSLMGS